MAANDDATTPPITNQATPPKINQTPPPKTKSVKRKGSTEEGMTVKQVKPLFSVENRHLERNVGQYGPPRMAARFRVPFSPVMRSHSAGPPCNTQYPQAQRWFPAGRSILGSGSGPDSTTGSFGSSGSGSSGVPTLRISRLQIYEEMSDPFYGLVTCDGFRMEDRYVCRVK